MRVILHTGWRKTGTSAIQYWLDANRLELRARQGINYPETGLFGRAHHAATWRELGKQPRRVTDPGTQRLREGGFRDMLAESERLGCSAMIASSEALSNNDANLPGRLAATLAGHVVQVIAYVRRQDHYIEARYNQRVKDGRPTPELERYAREQLPGLDYHEHFRRWSTAFGRENVNVRIYDRSAFPQADVRLDFLRAAGLASTGFQFEEGLRNASLTFSGLQFLRRYAAAPAAGRERRRLVRLLERYARRHPDHGSLFSPEERREILERFRESNRRFAREFLGREDVFEISPVELEAEAMLDREFGEERFLDMLRFVNQRLLAQKVTAPARKTRRGG